LFDLFEDRRGDQAIRDFAKCDHRGLVVLELNHWVGSMSDATRALRRDEHHLENVFDVFEAIFDGNTGHGLFPVKAAEFKAAECRGSRCGRVSLYN
jgi:hypothetical protein